MLHPIFLALFWHFSGRGKFGFWVGLEFSGRGKFGFWMGLDFSGSRKFGFWVGLDFSGRGKFGFWALSGFLGLSGTFLARNRVKQPLTSMGGVLGNWYVYTYI